MSGQMMVCDHGGMCGEGPCHHKTEHEEIGHCQETLRVCWKGIGGVKCIPVQHPKPSRKRSAPLYGELLNERELLKIENHNLRLEIQSLRMANEGLRNRLTGYDTASLSKLVALWFRNRKGGGE